MAKPPHDHYDELVQMVLNHGGRMAYTERHVSLSPYNMQGVWMVFSEGKAGAFPVERRSRGRVNGFERLYEEEEKLAVDDLLRHVEWWRGFAGLDDPDWWDDGSPDTDAIVEAAEIMEDLKRACQKFGDRTFRARRLREDAYPALLALLD